MAILRVNPTRMELTRLKKRRETALHGHKLLKDKRDEMVRQFIELIRNNKEMRTEVEKLLLEAQSYFALSMAVMGKEALEEALAYPSKAIELKVSSKYIMNVDVPVLSYEEKPAGKNTYGFVSTSSELDLSIKHLSAVFAKMIKLAELEKTISLLANEIEKIRRRVNALEYVMIPQLEETIKYIQMKLDEDERVNTIILLRMKEIIANASRSTV